MGEKRGSEWVLCIIIYNVQNWYSINFRSLFGFDRMMVNIYDYSVYYRGRRIEESSEPPESFIQTLTQNIIQSAILRKQVLTHECNSECAISSFVTLGYPCAENLYYAVPRYTLSFFKSKYWQWNFRGVRYVVDKAERRLSEMYGSAIRIRTIRFDAYPCPLDFELDNIIIDLYWLNRIL